jgi:hypothetical protein
VLDRRDLLARHAALTGRAVPLPDPADAAAVCAMDCARLRAIADYDGTGASFMDRSALNAASA